MARTSYSAPGVYVEEIPSARQPIAAVGTNTAGFIGLFPDRIYYPVSNADFDPVTARMVLSLEELRTLKAVLGAVGKPDKDKQDEVDRQIEANTRELNTRIDALKESIAQLDARVGDEQTALDEADQAQKAAADAMAPLSALSAAEKKDKKEEITANRTAESQAAGAQATATRRLKETQDTVAAQRAEMAALQQKLDAPPPPAPALAPAPAPGAVAKGGPALPVEKESDFADATPDASMLSPSVIRPYTLVEFPVKVAALDTKLVTNFSEYTRIFGPFSAFKAQPDDAGPDPATWQYSPIHPGHHALTQAVNGFFLNGGSRAFVVRIETPDQLAAALAAFESIDELALIAAPGLPKSSNNWELLMSYAEDHENVFAILDSPAVVNDGSSNDFDIKQLSYGNSDNPMPRPCKNAAYYFPHIEVVDPAKQLQDSDPARQVGVKYRGRTYVEPSGYIAGIYARTDEERGVHKAPANCVVRGAVDLKYYISKPKQELLNPIGVNCIRNMNGSIAVWGARTCGGDRNGEWKYLSVRRLFLFLQESIDEGTQWVVFEPNDMALWGKIKLNVSAFLTNVWRTGALFGATPDEAFYIKCDAETNPIEVREAGQVITEIGVAIVTPAEFVIFRMTQSTGVRPN